MFQRRIRHVHLRLPVRCTHEPSREASPKLRLPVANAVHTVSHKKVGRWTARIHVADNRALAQVEALLNRRSGLLVCHHARTEDTNLHRGRMRCAGHIGKLHRAETRGRRALGRASLRGVPPPLNGRGHPYDAFPTSMVVIRHEPQACSRARKHVWWFGTRRCKIYASLFARFRTLISLRAMPSIIIMIIFL